MNIYNPTIHSTFKQEQENISSPYAIVDSNILADENLSNAEFRALTLILSYSASRGFCCVSSQKIKENFPFWKERNFRKLCFQLQEKGYICRIQHPLHKKGSMRYLIPRQYHEKFITYVIKQYKAYKYAGQVKAFFEGGKISLWEKAYAAKKSSRRSKRAKAKSPPKPTSNGTLRAAPADRHTTCRSINNINIINTENDSVEIDAALFKDQLKKELDKSNLDGQYGLRLYDSNPGYWDERRNPIGAIISAIKGGYGDVYIQQGKEQREKLDREKQKTECLKLGKTLARSLQKNERKMDLKCWAHEHYCEVRDHQGLNLIPYNSKGIEKLKSYFLLSSEKIGKPNISIPIQTLEREA